MKQALVTLSTATVIFALTIQSLLTPFTIDLLNQRVNTPYDLRPFTILAKQTLSPLIGVGSWENAKLHWQSLERAGLPTAYTPNEVSHLMDVKYLIDGIRMLGIICAIWIGLSLRSSGIDTRRNIHKATKQLVLVIVGISAFALLAWNRFFILFHQVFFPQGNWSFPVDSTLITLFPVVFWQGIAISLLLLSCSLLLVLKSFTRSK